MKDFISQEILFFPKVLLIALIGTLILVAINHKNIDFHRGISLERSFDNKPDKNGFYEDIYSLSEDDKKQGDKIAQSRMLDYYTSLDTYLPRFLSLLLIVLLIRTFYVLYNWAKAFKS